MDKNELMQRLKIVKLAASIGDDDTVILQISHLKSLNNSNLNEIISMLTKKNYRQAIYLIKNYLNEIDILDDDIGSESEKILNVEDMIKMSPLAKETIKEYKSSFYTKDDLEAFAKNIEKPIEYEYKDSELKNGDYEKTFKKLQEKNLTEEPQDNQQQEKVEEKKEDKEKQGSLQNVDEDTPLDEISAEVIGKKKVSKHKKVMSKYKALRSKFSKDKNVEVVKKKSAAQKVLSKAKNISGKLKINKNGKKTEESLKEVSQQNQAQSEKVVPKKEHNETHPPIPHIEQKFRKAFTLFPPIKQSDVWVEAVVKFLKQVASSNYTDQDVYSFLDEFSFYLEKNDIAKAAQVLLLASSTDSKFAQFILARELFSGKVLKRDLDKSYKIMKSLANQFYPDAVCDLAQFYEYGITVPKNKKIAQKLYEKAFELGVERAAKHINRLKESKGILSSLFNRL